MINEKEEKIPIYGIVGIAILLAVGLYLDKLEGQEQIVSLEKEIIPTCCELKQEYKEEPLKVVYAEKEAEPIRSVPFKD